MKKASILLAFLFLLLSIAPQAKAGNASLYLEAQNSNFKVGDILKVAVNVQSGGNELQQIRAKISYPADLLSVQDFSLSSLFPEKSPGGIIGNGIIFTGGYRLNDGTSESGLLGTITFKVSKAGEAEIALIPGSNMITPEPQDIYSGGNSLSFSLTDQNLPSPEIISATNPENLWSNNSNVTFYWKNANNSLAYSINLIPDNKAEQSQPIIVTTGTDHYSYKNIADGIWKFQIQARYPAGLSESDSYIIKIDSTPPLAIEAGIETAENNDGFQINFKTTDLASGIKSYQIQFDNNSFKSAASPYPLTDEETKSKVIVIKALDNAGNISSTVLPIKSYIDGHKKANLELQQEKINLFDIKAESVKRSWLEFYIVLGVIGLIFLAGFVWIILKKIK